MLDQSSGESMKPTGTGREHEASLGLQNDLRSRMTEFPLIRWYGLASIRLTTRTTAGYHRERRYGTIDRLFIQLHQEWQHHASSLHRFKTRIYMYITQHQVSTVGRISMTCCGGHGTMTRRINLQRSTQYPDCDVDVRLSSRRSKTTAI